MNFYEVDTTMHLKMWNTVYFPNKQKRMFEKTNILIIVKQYHVIFLYNQDDKLISYSILIKQCKLKSKKLKFAIYHNLNM